MSEQKVNVSKDLIDTIQRISTDLAIEALLSNKDHKIKNEDIEMRRRFLFSDDDVIKMMKLPENCVVVGISHNWINRAYSFDTVILKDRVSDNWLKEFNESREQEIQRLKERLLELESQ